MRSISFGVIGRVRDCSLSKFITWVVNSWQPWINWSFPFCLFFCTHLIIFFQLLVVDVPNLTKLGLVVAVLYGGLWREGWGWREALDSKNSLPTPNIQGWKEEFWASQLSFEQFKGFEIYISFSILFWKLVDVRWKWPDWSDCSKDGREDEVKDVFQGF